MCHIWYSMSCFPFSAFLDNLNLDFIFIKLTNSGSLGGVQFETLGGCNGAHGMVTSITAQVTCREPARESGLRIAAQINNILLLFCQPDL